jgi:hypothetical protein
MNCIMKAKKILLKLANKDIVFYPPEVHCYDSNLLNHLSLVSRGGIFNLFLYIKGGKGKWESNSGKGLFIVLTVNEEKKRMYMYT